MTTQPDRDFELYESFRDWHDIVEFVLDNMTAGSDTSQVQKEYENFGKELVYESVNSLKTRFDTDISTGEYRNKFEWEFRDFERFALLDIDELKERHELLGQLKFPRDGSKICNGDRGEYFYYRLPVYQDQILPIFVSSRSEFRDAKDKIQSFLDSEAKKYGNIGAGNIIRDTDTSLIDELQSTNKQTWSANHLTSLSPEQFEKFVAELYKTTGNEARVTPSSRDGGIDVSVEKPSGSILAVQVKRYSKSNTVGKPAVQQLVGARVEASADVGVIITSSKFSNPAIETASSFDDTLRLINGEELISALQQSVVNPGDVI